MLSEELVNHVADLARLHVDESEMKLYQKQLYDIMSEIQKIVDVDVTDEDIMISPCNNINTYSNDTIGPMLSKEEIFKNVKHTNGDYEMVPSAKLQQKTIYIQIPRFIFALRKLLKYNTLRK